MNESDRMMHRLLHDLRSPLGVAQGYLRLVKDGSLKTDADRDRALEKAAAAVGQVARMLQDVAGYLDERANASRTPTSAAAFAGQVEAVAKEHGFSVVQDGVRGDAMLDLPFGVSASAGAVVRVFETAVGRRDSSPATLRVLESDDELQFVASGAKRFDPWREPGLDLALAWQRIAQASGQIRSDQTSADGLAIAFPVRRTQV